jgi:hypothetical protein
MQIRELTKLLNNDNDNNCNDMIQYIPTVEEQEVVKPINFGFCAKEAIGVFTEKSRRGHCLVKLHEFASF